MRLIFDGNSVLNASLLRGTDHDQGRVITDESGKQVQVNSAQYGVDNFFDSFTRTLKEFDVAPRQVIVVWDGANAKLRRRTFLPQYKQGRDKAPEVSAELNKARERVTQMLLHLGAHVTVVNGFEADDVIGYLCKTLRTQRNIVVTADGDLCVLVDENTDVWRQGELSRNPYGAFPHKFITLYKSLVGDTGDKIPGAKGFGDAAFVKFVRTFGIEGLQDMQEMIENDKLGELKDSVADMKELGKILENKEMVGISWRAASLMIDEINTVNRPLVWQVGMVAQWNELDDDLRVHSLKEFYGTKTLVTASNYAKAREGLRRRMDESPFVALDIETSSSEESDEWIDRLNSVSEKTRGDKIDVLGHELTGMSLTFGANTQHTIYMTVDHAESDNITVDQCREMVECIPQSLNIIIQNRQFEFSVLYRTWGDKWMNNGWHGFIPNALDTKIGASYVNENLPKGLKQSSKHYLGYEQTTYEQVTTLSGPAGSLKGGNLKKTFTQDVEGVPVVFESRQYKMRELSAERVFDYGCDDTICTAALHTHYQLVMELENTWHVYLEVETLPEYLTTLAFVQGFEVSMPKLVELERKDDAAYDEAWAVFRSYLMKRGWAGTSCPVFAEVTPAAVKEAATILVDTDEVQFNTKKRKLDGMAMDLRAQFPDSAVAELLALAVESGDVASLNQAVKLAFTGEPKINFGSPKQMQNLLYNHLGVSPRLLNRMTEKQKEEDPVMLSAFKKRRAAKDLGVDLFSVKEAIRVGRKVVEPLTEGELLSLISKASTDDDTIITALAKDNLDEEAVTVLKALQRIKTIQTRRSLFYKTYRVIPHWRDGRIHPSLNQAEAVTRRYSSSAPNVQQMPKRGDGKEFREIVLPHHRKAVVGSEDFTGQELRLMAEQSGDENLTACYVGDNLKDVHSLTAVAAAIYLWGEEIEYEPFLSMLKSKDPDVAQKAKALRSDAKTVNFATQYDAQAENLSVQLLVTEEVAQKFIDAKAAAFPRIDPWKEEVRNFVEKNGYATTMLGARRHLREAMQSQNRAEAAKAGRQGPNFAIQGAGAEMAKLALASMWRRGIFTGKYDARFIAPIHDEVVFSAGADCAHEVAREVHECMTQPYAGMQIPIVSSISIGPNFGNQIECGEQYDEAVIKAAVKESLPS